MIVTVLLIDTLLLGLGLAMAGVLLVRTRRTTQERFDEIEALIQALERIAVALERREARRSDPSLTDHA